MQNIASTSISGNVSPCVNNASTYMINVYNRGPKPQSTASLKTPFPLQRNLALLCLHFAKNIRRTPFLKTGVPQEMAYSLEDHPFSLSKSNWALPMGLTHNYWQSLSKSNRTLDLSINLRRQTL